VATPVHKPVTDVGGAGAAAEMIELEIPARAEFVALARLVVSALASSDSSLADERIDDLKLAVSEAIRISQPRASIMPAPRQ